MQTLYGTVVIVTIGVLLFLSSRVSRTHQRRLQELARRHGLSLIKCSGKDLSAHNHGRYWLVNAEPNSTIVGYSLSQNDVQNQLTLMEELDRTGRCDGQPCQTSD